MADVTKLSDDELLEAIHLIPNDLVAESAPADEWMERSHVQRKLEKVGVSCTREQAIQISRQILKDAEAGRIEAADREAKQGAQYEEMDCSRGQKGEIMRTKFYIEATCANCYAPHRMAITPWFLKQNSRFLLNDALRQAEDMFIVDLVDDADWTDDDEGLLCKRCADKKRAPPPTKPKCRTGAGQCQK